jgi:putative transposase
VTKFAFIHAEKANHPHWHVRTCCRLLGVSRSGYYAWRDRPPSARSVTDAVLTAAIVASFTASRGTYGAPRVHADLADADVRVGRKRVARLMRNAGLEGVHRRRRRWSSTVADPVGAAMVPDLVARRFHAEDPDRLWVADVTYVPTVAGWLYLATVIDVFSRRVIGWSMNSTRKTDLVVDAVTMAVTNRRGEGAPGVVGVIHHSDHGGEYTSGDLERELKRIGALPSMGTVADCYDNSLAESFFATLETELFWAQPGRRFTSHREAKLAIFDYIEVFYNRRRRHSGIGNIPPVRYEQQHRYRQTAVA